MSSSAVVSRYWFESPVSSEAWVRIPPLPPRDEREQSPKNLVFLKEIGRRFFGGTKDSDVLMESEKRNDSTKNEIEIKESETQARSNRNNKMNSHLRGRENICQYSALPHLQRSFRDTEDDKDPYRPTQMSGPKNKTRKMNGIKKPRDCD